MRGTTWDFGERLGEQVVAPNGDDASGDNVRRPGYAVQRTLSPERSTFYAVTLAGQLLFYAAALAGWLLSRSGSAVFMTNVPYYFCSVNLASLVGLLEALRGRTYTTWTSSRR